MDAIAGCSVRMTNGNATSVCANGTSHGDASHLPYVMMNPSPSITADDPSGSMISGSRIFSRRVGCARANAAGKPKRIERITVAEAYVSELKIA